MPQSDETLMNVIKSRRSIRRFTDKKVEPEKLHTILEAARWAPSAGNSQPWELIVVEDRKTMGHLKMFMPGVMGNMELGSVLICICLDKKRETLWSRYDLGCLLQNILLCTHSLGLGACAVGGFEDSMCRQILSISEELEPCLFVALGYPEKEVPAPKRRSLEDIVIQERK